MKSLKKGFTLVELMVVIVIIGILAALAIPRFLGATNKTKATEFKPVLKQIYTLESAYQQERTDGLFGSLAQVGWDPPGLNGAVSGANIATATTAYFAYNLGAATIGPTLTAQLTAVATAAPVIALNASLANATPNANGEASMKGANGQPVVNGTDMTCILTAGDMRVPATALQLASIAGAIQAGACP